MIMQAAKTIVTIMTLDLMSPTEMPICIKSVSSADSEKRGV